MSDDDDDNDDDETIPFEHLITQTKYLQGLGIFRLALGLAWSPKIRFSLYGLNSYRFRET